MTLSKKHQDFVNEYFLCGMNGTEAYTRVYPDASRESARRNASRLLTNADILAEIDARLKEKHLSADEVLARLGDMARSDIAQFSKVRKVSDLDSDNYRGKTHVIKKFKAKIINDALGRQIEQVELELYDAQAALEKIGRHHGIFETGPDGSDEKPFIVKVLKGVSTDDL